jgi:ribosomal protein L11 methyltransferase
MNRYLQEVDWHSQWASFAKGFKNGLAHIDLAPYGAPQKTLLLKPGPGFGDLSHPTTALMLEFMTNRMEGEVTLDIGCGSGILSLAALFLGAKDAYGIDIDKEALLHAEENAKLNQLEDKVCYSKALPNKANRGTVLLNMILPEQKEVLKAHPSLAQRAKVWISSGILIKQRAEACLFYEQMGLEITEERTKGEWMGFLGKSSVANKKTTKSTSRTGSP